MQNGFPQAWRMPNAKSNPQLVLRPQDLLVLLRLALVVAG